jgi:glucosamine-phosphate N-acetyltransferase
MALEIRDLRAPDLDDSFFESLSSLAEVQLTRPRAVEIFRRRLKAGVRTYVAVLDGRIVGTASLLMELKFIHGGGVVGHVEDVAVHRDFQKRGIGKALVEQLTDVAKEAGCYKIILNCIEDRVPFYEGQGYRRYDVGMRLDLPAKGPGCASPSSVTPTTATKR